MKKSLLLFSTGIILLLSGCANKNNINFNDKYNICAKNNMPLPLWTCKKNFDTKNYILISFSTYQFNSLEDELNQNTRKKVLQESVKYFIKKHKKFICSIIGIKEENFNKYKNKIFNLLTNNINSVAFIDKIFIPFEQSNMRINSYVLVAYNKKKLINLLKKLKTNKNILNNRYQNYYK